MVDLNPAGGRRPDPDAIRSALLAWFAAHRRDLPWRRRRSLYGTWISEMMLQQTTVTTVIPYWERFLARFPDVAALAAAPEDEVLAQWSGLGYYRRARQLHAAARQVMAKLDGVLPADHKGWQCLPGIGPYAAGAIASIGLGQREPAVDVNVRRVLGRWLAEPGQPAVATRRAIDDLASELVPAAEAGAWNEALMELGALICTPKRPACQECPVRRHCGAGAGAQVAEAPRTERSVATPVGVVMVAFLAGDVLWLEPSGGPPLDSPGAGPVERSDFARLHPGLLTLPMTAWHRLPARAADQPAAGAAVLEALVSSLRAKATLSSCGGFRHAITRYRLTVAVVAAGLPDAAARGGTPPTGREAGIWVPAASAGGLHVSQLARKALRLVVDARG